VELVCAPQFFISNSTFLIPHSLTDFQRSTQHSSFHIPNSAFRIPPSNSFLIPHFKFHIDQYLIVIHPITRLPIVSPNGCSLCVSFNALKAERATSASRR
jgi:hypothetical protein